MTELTQRVAARIPSDPVEFWLERLDQRTRPANRSHLERWMKLLRKQPGWEQVTPRELLIRHLDSEDSFLVLDLAQRYVNQLVLRKSSKRKAYSVIRSFFVHNRCGLPLDPSFRIRGDKPPVQAKLSHADIYELLLGAELRYRSMILFKCNLNSYFNLKSLSLPNLRPMIVAGFGPNESFLLRQGKSKDRMTVVSEGNRPCFHPDLWSDDFRKLYEDFTTECRNLDPMFSKMPMYGIKDRFDLGWVKRAIRQGKEIYGERFYDSKYATTKNMELEDSFSDLLDKFFLVDNQTYYSAMIKV